MVRRLLWLSIVFLMTGDRLAAGTEGIPSQLPVETRKGAEAVRDRALTDGRALDWVRSLTDEVGPRLAGSAGDRAAGAWGKHLFETLGFQNVRLESVPVKVWARESESGEILTPTRHRLALTALGGSIATPPEGLEAEVVEVSSLEALSDLVKERPDACRGKIVFFSRKMERASSMNGYGAVVSIRGQGPSRAAAAGAVGVVIRSVGTSVNRLPHTGSLSYATGVPKIPAAALSNPDADLLARLVARGKPVRLHFRLDCGDKPDAVSSNIVGEVAGSERPDEIVVVSCHIDSWDLGTGAVDDGAGCAIAIEVARLISTSPHRPRRTVRVVLFANEESGLAGGRTYAVEHAAELPKHVAAFEADSGAERPTGFSWNAGPSARVVIGEIAKLLEPIMVPKVEEGGGGGADISPLLKAGVPLLGLSQETTRYFDIHHSADDTFDKIDKAPLDQATAALAALVYAVADLPERLPQIPEGSRVRKRP